ncbi:hypothetical protein Zm00014a_017617 [Zea mays]|jgi:hypothetical protein|uniref:Uncharacterized protein n=1 Tax=Zea mays TaxID=4577 RepID=A0A3L6EL92_MAIZE|nr:hypothetical protein Zm00014a_017617 [Zea mays]
MAPRSRLLDLEKHDVLFFYGDGAYHMSQRVSVATRAIAFWPVFLVAALLLHLIAPFPHAAAVCGALYVFLLDRAAQASCSSSWPSTATAAPTAEASRPTTRSTAAGYTVVQN